MSTPMTPIALPPTGWRRLLRQLRPFLLFGAFAWLLWGRVPAFLSPTVNRTLYFKLPIDGTRFHWTFGDRLAFEAGELTLRIVNTKRGRDQTIVIFRHGQVSAGWEMIAGSSRVSDTYFGYASDTRFPTAVGDSLIITLVATEDLPGRGPHARGTLPKGTWVATGTYSALYGGTLNPLSNVVFWGKPPAAFLTCWDTTWVLQDVRDDGWMGPRPADENDGLRPGRGVDGRRCRSTL